MQGYVDIYLLPVPKANLDSYREQALMFGQVVLEYGGLAYREFTADDLGSGADLHFVSAPQVDDDEILTSAVAEFTSREHRDEVMAKVLADDRVKAMEHDSLANMNKMNYGGFKTFINAVK